MNPCKSCGAFAPFLGDAVWGRCRALAPAPAPSTDPSSASLYTQWPLVLADGPGSGCAQWRPLPLAQGYTDRVVLSLRTLVQLLNLAEAEGLPLPPVVLAAKAGSEKVLEEGPP